MIRIIEVKVSTSKKFAKKTTKTVDAKKLSVTVKKLQPNKKYFAKVRAYVIVNGTKVYLKSCRIYAAAFFKQNPI